MKGEHKCVARQGFAVYEREGQYWLIQLCSSGCLEPLTWTPVFGPKRAPKRATKPRGSVR